MCGNGARCAARFALLKGIVDKERTLSFMTLAGLNRSTGPGEGAKVRMTQPHSLEIDIPVELDDCLLNLNFINTGVPHAVFIRPGRGATRRIWTSSVWGRCIRFHQRFQPAGSNANFVFVRGPHDISIRTYERGVEGETLACGTGSIAAALVAAAKDFVVSPVDVRTRSGETLVIHFEKSLQEGAIIFSDVYLEGDAKVVYDAELWDETLRR